MYALCYPSGEIVFASTYNAARDPCLPVAHGDERKLKRRIDAVARHAYDGVTLLVPGIPEAENQSDGVDALLRFQAWIKPFFEKDGLSVP
jgi:hypothetical protein